MRRVLPITAGILVALILGLIAWTVYSSSRQAEPKRAATSFIQAISTYGSDTSLDEKIAEIEGHFVDGRFESEFDAPAYAKGMVFNQELGVSQRAEIEQTKLSEIKGSSAVANASFTLITSSPEETTRQRFEQTIHLKKIGASWKIDRYEERSLDG